MLKAKKFERIRHYLTRVYLTNNRERYEEVTKGIYLTRKVTKSNLDFLLDYNRKSENTLYRLPEDVMLNDEEGIVIYMNSQGKLKVQKYEYSYVSLDD